MYGILYLELLSMETAKKIDNTKKQIMLTSSAFNAALKSMASYSVGCYILKYIDNEMYILVHKRNIMPKKIAGPGGQNEGKTDLQTLKEELAEETLKGKKLDLDWKLLSEIKKKGNPKIYRNYYVLVDDTFDKDIGGPTREFANEVEIDYNWNNIASLGLTIKPVFKTTLNRPNQSGQAQSGHVWMKVTDIYYKSFDRTIDEFLGPFLGNIQTLVLNNFNIFRIPMI